MINDRGFGSYYQKRIESDYTKLKPTYDTINNFCEFIEITENNKYSINFLIENIECASCVWLIESLLHSENDIEYARINMSTNKMKIIWNSRQDRINSIIDIITRIGYKVTPGTTSNIQNTQQNKLDNLLKALAIAGFGSGNLMLISISLWSSNGMVMGFATRELLHWISCIIALPITFYSGLPFYISAWNAVKFGRLNMDVPISFAVLLTAFISLVETIYSGKYIYFESSVMLLFFLLIGRYLDQKFRLKARTQAQDLLNIVAGTAKILDADNNVSYMPFDKLEIGMIMLVSAGEKIIADGIIIKGVSELDTAMLTGETTPKLFSLNQQVFAGMVNLTQPIEIKIEKAGDTTVISEVIKLLDQTENIKNKFIDLSSRISRIYTPVIHLIAVCTFIYWFMVANIMWQQALLNAVTVLIITCPCALGLAIPTVNILTSYQLLKKGILLKNGRVLERINNIKYIVFDKTGTLTLGKPSLIDTDKYLQQDLKLAASLANYSKHPYAKAIANAYEGPLISLTVQEHASQGMSAVYEGNMVKLGSASFCEINNSTASSLFLKHGDKIVSFQTEDPLRPEAAFTLKALARDYTLTICSGDREDIVQHIAEELNIKNYYAGNMPHEKHDVIKELQKSGDVMMIGDGINDALSLKHADISISPASAAELTQNTADIVFQGDTLSPILSIIYIAKLANKLIRQNIALAIIYNVIAIPFAVSGTVTPLFAALLMSSSSILVTLNSLRVSDNK